MEEAQQVMRYLTRSVCPHCNKEITIGHFIGQPMIKWVLSDEQIKTAKEDLTKKLDLIDFVDKEEKKTVLKQLSEDQDAVFSPLEVDKIIENIKDFQDVKRKDNNKK
jgi:hypothetical protein